MSTNGRLIRYPEERALEDAAFTHGLMPTRIFALLLPIWRVDVRACVTAAEPYALIDRYLELGIGTAGLDSVTGLAGFFGLDDVVVERALRFLAGIGHVTMGGGRVALTELGQRSVRDGKRYLVTRQDRRTMYFDGFGSRPLTHEYYDSRVVTFLTYGAAAAAAGAREWPRFMLVYSPFGFRREALASLAGVADRERYNLPEGIDQPESLGEEVVYLPVYVVRAVSRDHKLRYLAYSQADDQADTELSALCERTAGVTGVLENEELSGSGFSGSGAERAKDWLERQGVDGYSVVRLDSGMVRATLPGRCFGGAGPLSLSKVGSFVMLGGDFFHVWCGDERVRRAALVERVDAYLSSAIWVDRLGAEGLVGRIGRQLDLGEVDLVRLCRIAVQVGRSGLAAHLERLLAETGAAS
jgi:hypothetical protein